MRDEAGSALMIPPGQGPSGEARRLMIPATAVAVRGALADLRCRLRAAGVSVDAADRVELVLAEVLNNIVEHAMTGRSDGVIVIVADHREDWLDCEVSDDGRPMPSGGPPEPPRSRTGPDPAALPEGGFGWGLIRSMTDRLAYAREGAWNRLRFRISLGPGDTG